MKMRIDRRVSLKLGSALAHYEGINAFSETDQTEDLKAITVPTLVLQGDDDQVVPYKDASLLQAKLLKHGTLKVNPGFPHGLMTTHADVIDADTLQGRDRLYQRSRQRNAILQVAQWTTV